MLQLYFEHAEHSHISHFTYHLSYYIIIDHDLTSYIKLCYVYVNFNKPIKVADLQKLVNQLMLNGTLVIEIVNNSLSESKKNFDKARNFLIKTKIEILRAAVKNV